MSHLTRESESRNPLVITEEQKHQSAGNEVSEPVNYWAHFVW